MLKDVLGSIKDGMNDKEHEIQDDTKEDKVMAHQIKIAHDYEDIKPEELENNSSESIESLLKKTSKLKALEISMKETEDQYEDWKKGASKDQGPIAKASLESSDEKKKEVLKDMKKDEKKPEVKEEKKAEVKVENKDEVKDVKKAEKEILKEMEPVFKAFSDPTWNPKDDDATKDVDDNQFPGHVNENQIDSNQ